MTTIFKIYIPEYGEVVNEFLNDTNITTNQITNMIHILQGLFPDDEAIGIVDQDDLVSRT